MERKIGLTPIPRSGKERVLKLNYFRLILNYMERKIGFTPIPRSGKERVLKVELLPHRKINGAEDRICTYTSFQEGMYSKS